MEPYAAVYLYAAGFHPGAVARGVGIQAVTYDAVGMFWFVVLDEVEGVSNVVIAATLEDNIPATIAVSGAGEPNEWNVAAYDAAGDPIATPSISVTWSRMVGAESFPP